MDSGMRDCMAGAKLGTGCGTVLVADGVCGVCCGVVRLWAGLHAFVGSRCASLAASDGRGASVSAAHVRLGMRLVLKKHVF